MVMDFKFFEVLKKDDGIVLFFCLKCFCSFNLCDLYVLINKKKFIECCLEFFFLYVMFVFFEFQFLVWFYYYFFIVFYVYSIFESMYSIYMG